MTSKQDETGRVAHGLLRHPLAVTGLVLVLAAFVITVVMAITTPPEFKDDAVLTVKVDQARLRAEVAVSEKRMAKGLMDAKSLPDDRGMLFVYGEPTIPTFWMKGVEFPIDIVWISGDTVTQVTSNVPPAKPGAPDAELPKYQPEGPVDKILEVHAGWVVQHSIQPGDPVRFSR